VARTPLSPQEIDRFRERLCRIATRRFAEQGYAGVTLRGLATELGCSPTTPYRYFSNKQEIFAAVRAAAFRRIAAACESAARAESDPVARLRRLATSYLRFAAREPHAYRIMFELAQPEASDYPELARQERRAWQVLNDSVEAAVRARCVAGEPMVLAHVFWAGLHGLAALQLAGKLVLCRVQEISEPLIETLLRGAAAPDASTTRVRRPGSRKSRGGSPRGRAAGGASR
jgi:AcrR family transcriptional regulator